MNLGKRWKESRAKALETLSLGPFEKELELFAQMSPSMANPSRKEQRFTLSSLYLINSSNVVDIMVEYVVDRYRTVIIIAPSF